MNEILSLRGHSVTQEPKKEREIMRDLALRTINLAIKEACTIKPVGSITQDVIDDALFFINKELAISYVAIFLNLSDREIKKIQEHVKNERKRKKAI